MSLAQSDGIKQGTFTITIVFARSEVTFVIAGPERAKQ